MLYERDKGKKRFTLYHLIVIRLVIKTMSYYWSKRSSSFHYPKIINRQHPLKYTYLIKRSKSKHETKDNTLLNKLFKIDYP